MTTTEVLQRIYDNITEENWTKRFFARDINDYCVKLFDPQAVKFCLYGRAKIECLVNHMNINSVYAALNSAVQTKGYFLGITDFNDDEKTTFKDVKEVVLLAISISKGA